MSYCTKHSAVITDRGGGQVIARLENLSEVKWNRLLDDMSYASITLDEKSCSTQIERLDLIEPRRHELVIYREGKRVWEGPLAERQQRGGSLTLVADDVLTYLDHRPLSSHWPGPDNYGPPLMGDRISRIITSELSTPYVAPGLPAGENLIESWEPGIYFDYSVDPPINVLEHLDVRPGTVMTYVETYPFEMSVYEHLTNLAEGGLDFTTIGRKILIWDSALDIGQTRTMTTADFDGAIGVYASGRSLVGVQHVISPRDEDPENPLPPGSTANVGSALRDMEYYGPWAKIHTRSEEGENITQEALNTQALRVSAGRNPVPIEIVVGNQARIILDDLMPVESLVAGASVPIIAEISGRKVNSVQRFSAVYFSETSAGESITGTLTTARAVS